MSSSRRISLAAAWLCFLLAPALEPAIPIEGATASAGVIHVPGDDATIEQALMRAMPYDTILVSDAGLAMRGEPKPAFDWVRHSLRVLDVIDNQVRSLRKRQLIHAFSAKERKGTYWGIRSDTAKYELPDSLPAPRARVLDLATTATRLAPMGEEREERLINWGYAICDTAIRRWVDRNAPPPAGFPYPARGV